MQDPAQVQQDRAEQDIAEQDRAWPGRTMTMQGRAGPSSVKESNSKLTFRKHAVDTKSYEKLCEDAAAQRWFAAL